MNGSEPRLKVHFTSTDATCAAWFHPGAGRPPRLVPSAGRPGYVAALTTADAVDGDPVLNPGNTYPDWQQTVAARSALLVVVGENYAVPHQFPAAAHHHPFMRRHRCRLPPRPAPHETLLQMTRRTRGRQ